MTIDQKTFNELIDEWIENDRPKDKPAKAPIRNRSHCYASYFSWSTNREQEEIGVVQSFCESLEQDGKRFFHSYSSRGRGNDPPDCEAVSNDGQRIAIEVTELVDSESIRKAARGGCPNFEPFTKEGLYERLSKLLAEKNVKLSRAKDSPYEQCILLIFCDDPRAKDNALLEYVRASSFLATDHIDKAFLLYSYCPWEKCCPYIELNLSRV